MFLNVGYFIWARSRSCFTPNGTGWSH